MPERDPGQFDAGVPEHQPWYRLVPSRFPPAQLWERVANPEELHAAATIESLTNPRLAGELGQVTLVPEHDWLFGTGTTPIMAAFCHPNHAGSRFSPGTFGIYYAADSLEAAMREVSWHRQRWYAENRLPARTDTFRTYVGPVVKPLIDIRAEPQPRVLHDPDYWTASRRFGTECREAGHWGIHYRSVRCRGAECVALLRPPAIAPVVQSRHVQMHWDGRTVSGRGSSARK